MRTVLLERLGLVNTYATLPAPGGDVAQVADLPASVAQAFGINVETERVTRREAKSIPAMRRGEQVIAGTISTFPLISQRIPLGEDGRTAPVLPDRTPVRRSLLERPDPRITRSEWVRRVVEDLIYTPYSWCRVGGRDADGFPLWLEHLDQRFIAIDFSTNTFRYKGQVVPELELVRFDSPGNGVLYDGATTLRTALMLEAAVRRYADDPMPLGLLRDPSQATSTGRDKVSDTWVQRLLDKWHIGGKKRATRYIGRLEYVRVQFDAAQIQLVQARERSDVAIAQMLNLESNAVNAPSETGMTYTTKESIAAERVNAVRPYMDAIVQRLSADDITPRGQVVIFDTAGYVRGTTAEVINAAVAATSGDRPLMAVDEARYKWLDLPPLPGHAGDEVKPTEQRESAEVSA